MACGPLCSAFMMIITLWGVIFLGIVGLLFQQESVGLLEDLPKWEKDEPVDNSTMTTTPAGNHTETPDEFWAPRFVDLRQTYKDKALYTWYAAAAHAVTFVLAFGRFMMVKNRL